MAGGLDEEQFCHTESAAGSLGGSAVIHESQALLRHFAQEYLPSSAHELLRVHLRGGLRLLGLLAVLAVAIAVAAALAAAVGATLAATYGFGCSKAGSGGKLGRDRQSMG